LPIFKASEQQKAKAREVLEVLSSKRTGNDDIHIARVRALAIAREVYAHPNEDTEVLASLAGDLEDQLYNCSSDGKPGWLDSRAVAELRQLIFDQIQGSKAERMV
jgi:hypothetical protein